MAEWTPSCIPSDHFKRFSQMDADLFKYETEYIAVGHNLISIYNSIDQALVISAFALSDQITYLECLKENTPFLIGYFQKKRLIYNLSISSNDIKTFIWHCLIWKVFDRRGSRSFGYVSTAPYWQLPVQIFDISQNGKAKVVILPESWDCIDDGTPCVAEIGHGESLEMVHCTLKNGIKRIKGLPLHNVPVQALFLSIPLRDKDCSVFFQHVPELRIHTQFSYITDTLQQHMDELRGDINSFVSDSEDDFNNDFELQEEIEEEFPEEHGEGYSIKQTEVEDELTPDSNEKHQDLTSDSFESESEEDPPTPEEEIPESDEEIVDFGDHPILKGKRRYISRFYEPDWPKVATLLLDAQNEKRINWKRLESLIGGGHKIKTLQVWYRRLKADPNYRPDPKLCGIKNKALTPEEEESVWKIITNKFLNKKLLFTDLECQAIAKNIHSKRKDKPKKEFLASRNWVLNFRKAHMISLRTAHVCRRPQASQKDILNFYHSLKEAIKTFPANCIINCDETNWPVIFTNRKTWILKTGKKSQHQDVKAYVNGDTKSSFTAMASITYSGEALPLFMLARGKTERCEKQLKKEGMNKVTHSQNGWVTIQVMGEFFQFLREIVEKKFHVRQRQQIFLVLDVYASHREGYIKALAAAQRISLLFIPPGMTAEFQPLDAKIFGILKSIGSNMWVSEYLFDPSKKFTKLTASHTIQDYWKKLAKETIQEAWKTVMKNAKKILQIGTEIETTEGEEEAEERKSDSDYQEPKEKEKKKGK
jgi:hypothetical protein